MSDEDAAKIAQVELAMAASGYRSPPLPSQVSTVGGINWLHIAVSAPNVKHDVVPPDIEAEREAFEEWYDGDRPRPLWLMRDDDGNYAVNEVHRAWLAWWARAQR